MTNKMDEHCRDAHQLEHDAHSRLENPPQIDRKTREFYEVSNLLTVEMARASKPEKSGYSSVSCTPLVQATNQELTPNF